MINFNRTLEIAGISGFVQPLRLVQYDDTLPVGMFDFTENGQPFDIPSGAKAKVRMIKADGKGVYNDAVISGDTVQVVFTQQMTAAHGDGFLNIELIYDGGVKSSEPVQVIVMENALQEDYFESSDEFLTLDEIVKQVETLRQQTAVDAASASTSKTAAASSATAAQAARQGAEAAESRVNAIVAGNEAYTKQESNNLFARALKAETDKAASLEIYPDEGSNITVTTYGFTEQAGTGDASPTNVRKITVGGKKLIEVVFDGSSDEVWVLDQNSVTSASGSRRFACVLAASCDNELNTKTATAFASRLIQVTPGDSYGGAKDNVCSFKSKNFYVRINGVSTIEQLKLDLSENPLKAWYAPSDESQATGIYTQIETNGSEYRCVCIPIKRNLCKNSTVSTSGVEYHLNAYQAFNGTENWSWGKSSGGVYRAMLNTVLSPAPKIGTLPICTHAKSGNNYSNPNGVAFDPSNKKFLIALPTIQKEDGLEEFKKYLSEQYSEGTPLAIEYEIETPVTYLNDLIRIEAYPDGNGKFTVSGEKLVSAKYNKSLNRAFEELLLVVENLQKE